jgi:hypothetical protein
MPARAIDAEPRRPYTRAGVEGGFRSGCERALCALRANSALLCALLEAALLDPGVDWDSEGAAKAGSKVGTAPRTAWHGGSLRAARMTCCLDSLAKGLLSRLVPSVLQAFGRAVALQLFALRLAGGAAELSAVASSASASLAAARTALAAYLQQLQGAAGAAAAAAESHALVQRCQATLGSAEVQERALTEQADEARGMLAGLMHEAQPLAAQALASLQECQVGTGGGRLLAGDFLRLAGIAYDRLSVVGWHSSSQPAPHALACRLGRLGMTPCCPCC